MIYIITTIEHPSTRYRKDGTTYEHRANRSVGHAETYKEAEEWITDNVMDINEAGYYPYTVVEAYKPGIYMYGMEPIFFEWDTSCTIRRDKGYVKLDDTPEEFKQIVGYGLG